MSEHISLEDALANLLSAKAKVIYSLNSGNGNDAIYWRTDPVKGQTALNRAVKAVDGELRTRNGPRDVLALVRRIFYFFDHHSALNPISNSGMVLPLPSHTVQPLPLPYQWSPHPSSVGGGLLVQGSSAHPPVHHEVQRGRYGEAPVTAPTFQVPYTGNSQPGWPSNSSVGGGLLVQTHPPVHHEVHRGRPLYRYGEAPVTAPTFQGPYTGNSQPGSTSNSQSGSPCSDHSLFDGDRPY